MRFFKCLSVLSIVFFLGSLVSAQTETLDAAQFTPPAGWTRTVQNGVVVFSDVNKAAGRFCILSIYRSVPSTGDPKKDFAGRWNELVVKPFKAAVNPETESKIEDGWTAFAGGTQIDSDGTKAVAILTVYSGFGKAVAVLSLFNDESYLAKIDAFGSGLKLDKTLSSGASPARQDPAPSNGEYLDADPFPDKPGYQPQKPLTGRLKRSVTMADLVGKWESGASSVESYYSSSTGDYAGTNTVFYAETYTISPNGTFAKTFAGRANNHTIREKDAGTVTISKDGFIILDFNGRITYKYQPVAYMVDEHGGAILTLMQIGADEPALNADRLRLNCGHSKGFVSCVIDEEWVRRPAK